MVNGLELLKKLNNMIFIRVIDLLVALILKSILYPILLIYKIAPKLQSNSRKKIFLCSGSAYQFPAEHKNDSFFKNRWNKGFRSQLLHETFDITYALYFGEKNAAYKLCSGVITIIVGKVNLGPFKKISGFCNLIKSLCYSISIHKKKKLCAIETFFPGSRLIESIFFSQITHLPLIAQCQGDSDLSSFEDSMQKESIKRLLRQWMYKSIYSLFLRQASLVLGYNDHCASFSIINGAHPNKVRRCRIHSFIKDFQLIETLDVQHLEGVVQGKKVLFLWGRLEVENKLYYALEAIKQILKETQDIVLLIAGSGSLMGSFKVQMSDVADRVFFLGQVDRRKIKSYIINADVNISPLGGHTLVEAGLCSKPVVVFNFEWHTEVITNMESGILVDYPNIADFKQAVLFLLNNPKRSSEMGIKFNKRIVNLFDDDIVRERERKIFQDFYEEQRMKS